MLTENYSLWDNENTKGLHIKWDETGQGHEEARGEEEEGVGSGISGWGGELPRDGGAVRGVV